MQGVQSWGGLKFYTLKYANDIAIMAEDGGGGLEKNAKNNGKVCKER